MCDKCGNTDSSCGCDDVAADSKDGWGPAWRKMGGKTEDGWGLAGAVGVSQVEFEVERPTDSMQLSIDAVGHLGDGQCRREFAGRPSVIAWPALSAGEMALAELNSDPWGTPDFKAWWLDSQESCLYVPGWFEGPAHDVQDYVTNTAFSIAMACGGGAVSGELDKFVTGLLPDADDSDRGHWTPVDSRGQCPGTSLQRRAAFGLVSMLGEELQYAEDKAAATRCDLYDDDPHEDDVHEDSRECCPCLDPSALHSRY